MVKHFMFRDRHMYGETSTLRSSKRTYKINLGIPEEFDNISSRRTYKI
jgi:hypothetical protein